MGCRQRRCVILHRVSGCTACCIASNESSLPKKEKKVERETSSLAWQLCTSNHVFLKKGGLGYITPISRIFPNWFLLFLNVGEFSPAGGAKLGLGAEGPAPLPALCG